MRRRVPLLRDLLLALRWPSGHASSSTLRDISSSTLRDASSSTLRGCSLASSHVCNRCWQSSLYHRDSKRPRHLSAVDGNSLACPTREPTTEQYFKDMETSICSMQTEEEASGIDCPQYDFKDMMESLCSIKKEEEDLCSIKKEEEEDLCSIKKEEEEDTSEIDETKKLWESEQVRLKKLCSLEDTEPWEIGRLALGITSSEEEEESTDQVAPLIYIAGTDISFVKNNETNACAAIVVVKLPSFEVVYEDISMVELTAPYIPGFLAFREADFLIKKLELLRESRPDIIPQAIIVDGNGIFHPREFGLACHIGVHLGIPTVGAAKTLYHVDGIEKNEDHQNKIKTLLKRGGDQFPLVGQSGKTLGVALRSCQKSTNPIYISPGHNISMETAVWLVQLCCKFRVPEPVRQADIKSREYIRENWKPDDAA